MSGFNESALYNKHCLRGQKVVCLFFGELDAQLCWQDGIPSVSPTNGKESFRAEWLKYFDGIERVIIIPDRDDPEKLIPRRKVTLANLNVKEKESKGIITEMESALVVADFFGRQARIKTWNDNFPEKDYNANRMAGMSPEEFRGWIKI